MGKSNEWQTDNVYDVNGRTPIFEFEDNYNIYLNDRGLRTYNRRKLTNLLRDHGFDIDRDNVKKDNGDWTKWTFIYGLKKKEMIGDFVEK